MRRVALAIAAALIPCGPGGAAQIGAAQIGSAQIGSAQIGSAQIGSAQIGSAQIGTGLLAGLAAVGAAPGQQCRAAIERAERVWHIPPHLLAAIGRVESGRRSADGRIDPWPYSVDVEGQDGVFDTKVAAIMGVRAARAAGSRSIDVGCLQVNLMYHPDAFATLDDAFDPWRNADYAARFLVQLYGQSGSWVAATASYHSATPELGLPYAAKVQAAFAEEAGSSLSRDRTALLPGAAQARPAAALVSLGAVGRPALGLPPPRPGATAGAITGRGLDAYRRDPVRVMPSLFRR